jgi:hypothetical protein
MTNAEKVAAVRTHAYKHYEDGWDVVIECWDDEEILERVGKAETPEGCVKKLAPIVKAIYGPF